MMGETGRCSGCGVPNGSGCLSSCRRYNPRALAGGLASVLIERDRQDTMWGEQNHEPPHWLAILGEEVGEVAKEVADGIGGSFDADAYRGELVQVAAVALAAIEALDRSRSGE